MKLHQTAVFGFAILTATFAAQAHEIDPGGKIVVTCPADQTVRLAAIGYAIDDSRFWAPLEVRKRMLVLARQRCATGAKVVTFVPSIDQRYTSGSAVGWALSPPR